MHLLLTLFYRFFHSCLALPLIQTILRREEVEGAYELLKGLTRTNEKVTRESIDRFIDELPVSDAVKAEMHVITPENYTGYSF